MFELQKPIEGTRVRLPALRRVQLEQVYRASIENIISTDFVATHNIVAFEYLANTLVLKEATKFAGPINFYYALQDTGFLASRKFYATRNMQIIAEAQKLTRLQHQHKELAPTLLNYDANRAALVRTYIKGITFREMTTEQQVEAIPNIVELVQKIHDSDVAIGDAHIKNAIQRTKDNKYLWLDFDGCFDEENISQAKANDLIKLVYSTFSETANIDLAVCTAKNLEGYKGDYPRVIAQYFISGSKWSPLLQWATGVNRQQHEMLKEAIIDSLGG